MDFNGRFARAYLISRLGYDKSLIYLYRLSDNRSYGYANYRKEALFSYGNEFYRYWDSAIRWHSDLVSKIEKMISVVDKDITRLLLFNGCPKEINVGATDIYANPTFAIGDSSLGS